MGTTPLLIAVKYGDHGGVAELAYAGVLKTLAGRLVGSNPTAPTINETDAGRWARVFLLPPWVRTREGASVKQAPLISCKC